MSTEVAKATTAKSFMPTGKEAIDASKNLGMIAGGMIAAHALVTMTKKDTAIVNGGIALVGLGVAMKVKNPLIKMICLGASAYGTIKLLNHATKLVAAPETTEGLNGLLPESAKALIRKFIPTLSGMDELLAGDEDFEGLSLDDDELRGDYDDMSGLGETEDLTGGYGDLTGDGDEMAGMGVISELVA